jgi:hypothetical protein
MEYSSGIAPSRLLTQTARRQHAATRRLLKNGERGTNRIFNLLLRVSGAYRLASGLVFDQDAFCC